MTAKDKNPIVKQNIYRSRAPLKIIGPKYPQNCSMVFLKVEKYVGDKTAKTNTQGQSYTWSYSSLGCYAYVQFFKSNQKMHFWHYFM